MINKKEITREIERENDSVRYSVCVCGGWGRVTHWVSHSLTLSVSLQHFLPFSFSSLSLYLYLYLSIYLSICLSVCLSILLCVSLTFLSVSNSFSTRPTFCLYMCLSFFLCFRMSFSNFLCLSSFLFDHNISFHHSL